MTVKEIFETMEYGPAPESAAEALAWLVDMGDSFGCFIDGAFTDPGETFETKNPATGAVLAHVTHASQDDVDRAVAAARAAQPAWAADPHARARALYAIARAIQKHSRLFAVLETLDNGKPIRESRDIDIPLVARHFYHHAGHATLMESALPGRMALGVCGQIVPWNFSLLMLAWKIAPALAAGNTVVLKPAEYTSLTALLFADICRRTGLPPGVVNIVTGDGAVGEMITGSDVDKIAFTGSTAVGRRIREATAGTGKSLTLELGGKSPYIVFDDADLDSAVEGLVDAIWFNQGQVCCAGSRLLVQETVADRFHDKLRARMDKLRIGDPLDKSIDVGAIVDPVQLDTITRLVDASTEGEIYRAAVPLPETGCFYPPTLITGLSPAAPLMREEIFGPVLVSTTFRTPAEAVQLANDTRYGLAATLWSENINLALDVAPKLAAGVVWVNGTNMFDAAAPFGGVRESGFGREGGVEGMMAYTRPVDSPDRLTRIEALSGDGATTTPLDRTAKLYVGGKQARPDGGYSAPVFGPSGTVVGEVPKANRKDIRNAVEAMNAAAGWAKSTGHARAQILYYLAENLSARATEFAARLEEMTGADGSTEVDHAIRRLFTWAAWADRFDGTAKGVPLRGLALALREPVGKIVAFAPDATPLLGAVSLIGPAMAMGNRITLVASEPFPLAATDLYQVLETSDVPPGVVNILTGAHEELAPVAAAHLDVDAVWSFSGAPLSAEIERRAAGNLKRTWVNHGRMIDLADDRAFLEAATEVKTVWVPYGE
ncbi:aldehyde dehydrogenase family protein [Histidinibacterium lentulum]|uniref:Aldehyde dehydrogenase family protein n=1 Tax=Histidinibacterium lentulum TaxID=2480588 RepID=A0A3N2R0N1_9RHOB|nr:aldehyde dehydrogenase family protein [Histidinibacterium lentulum]ROU01037.1 aldehyde dehydrogenase family protein [Histidinibacterium lentulum]